MGENLNQNPNQEINPNEKEFKFTKIIDDYCTVLVFLMATSPLDRFSNSNRPVHCRILR